MVQWNIVYYSGVGQVIVEYSRIQQSIVEPGVEAYSRVQQREFSGIQQSIVAQGIVEYSGVEYSRVKQCIQGGVEQYGRVGYSRN